MAGLLKNIFGGSETIGKDNTSLSYLMEKLANEAKAKEEKKSDNSNRIDQMPKGSNKGETIKNGGTGLAGRVLKSNYRNALDYEIDRKRMDMAWNVSSRINNINPGKTYYGKDGENRVVLVTPNHPINKDPYALTVCDMNGHSQKVDITKSELDILSKGSAEDVTALVTKKFPNIELGDAKPSVTMDDLTRDKDGHEQGMADARFKSKNGEIIKDVNGAVADMYPGKDVFYERENGRPVDVKNLKLVEPNKRLSPNFYSTIEATVNGQKISVPLNKEETEMYKEMDDWHRVELFDYKCGKIAIKDADNLNVKEGSVQALRTDNGAKLSIFRDGKVVEVGLSQKEVDKVMALDDSKRGKYLASLVPWGDLELAVPDKLELGKSSMRALSGNENNDVKDDNKEKGLDVKNVQAMVQDSFQSASVDNPENQERQRGAGIGM